MNRVLIVGDKFFDPAIVRQEIKNRLSDRFNLDIQTIKYDFPVEQFRLDDDTCVPSGMSWDDPNEEKEPCGVREFYGEPFALLNKLQGIHILIVHGAAVPREVLEQADQLKAVVVLRGGPVNIDRAYLEERGITIFNTNGKNAEGVAEFTIALLLSFLRNIPESSTFFEKWNMEAGVLRIRSHGSGTVQKKLRFDRIWPNRPSFGSNFEGISSQCSGLRSLCE